jgi:HK97 gp10 family phage protein
MTRHTEGGNPVQHIASNPGEPPNTDTGRLAGSVQVEVESREVFVGSTLQYAGALEFGTSQMQARPWLNPALEKSRAKVRKLFVDATAEVVRKG